MTAREATNPRATMVVCIVALALIVLETACVSTNATSTPSASSSVNEVVLDMGQRATTQAGNFVRVFSYVSPVPGSISAGSGMIFSAADIEACAGPHAASNTGVSRSQFALQTPDSTGWASVDPHRTPALKDTTLAPNHCERGWVTFRIAASQKAQYVVLLSSNIVKWRIP